MPDLAGLDRSSQGCFSRYCPLVDAGPADDEGGVGRVVGAGGASFVDLRPRHRVVGDFARSHGFVGQLAGGHRAVPELAGGQGVVGDFAGGHRFAGDLARRHRIVGKLVAGYRTVLEFLAITEIFDLLVDVLGEMGRGKGGSATYNQKGSGRRRWSYGSGPCSFRRLFIFSPYGLWLSASHARASGLSTFLIT